MKILAVYDNGGKTFDRYTVYFDIIERKNPTMYMCLGMSEYPRHPQGFGQHCSGQLGKHNGKKISFNELPDECKKLVNIELEI